MTIINIINSWSVKILAAHCVELSIVHWVAWIRIVQVVYLLDVVAAVVSHTVGHVHKADLKKLQVKE